MKKIRVILIVSILLIISSLNVQAASPTLFFQSSEMKIKNGDYFDVVIKVDTSNQNVTGADTVIGYNPEMLEVSSIENGGFFPLFGKHYEMNNKKIYITGFFTEKNQSKSGSGIFAKINMKALKNGIATLQFNCIDKSLSDTNLINSTGKDLIVCHDLVPMEVNISGGNVIVAGASSFGKILGTQSGSLVSPTLTPTLVPTVIPSSQSSTSSSLMEAGVFNNAVLLIILGSALIMLGGGAILISNRQD